MASKKKAPEDQPTPQQSVADPETTENPIGDNPTVNGPAGGDPQVTTDRSIAHEPVEDARSADAGSPSASAAGQDEDPNRSKEHAGNGGEEEGVEEVETSYEATATGHRVTRRVVRRTSKTETSEENLTETISEEYPVVGYQAPASTAHPAPVG